MYLERWNDAYWLTTMYVQPTRDGEVRINEDVFLTLQYELYPEGERKDDKSVMVRLEDRYFELEPDSNTPTGVLDIPQPTLEDELHIRNAPEKKPVLVVEPWFQDYVAWEAA